MPAPPDAGPDRIAGGDLPPTPLLLGALEAAEDGLLVMDLDGTPRYYNRRLTELLDLPPDLLDDGSFREALRRSRDLFRRPDRFQEAVEDNLRNPERKTRHEFRLRDGRVVQRFSRPLRVGGELVGRVSSIRDVTALREHERRLEEVQRLSRIGSWEWEIPHDEIRWTDQMYRIFGLDRDRFEATFDSFLEHVHPDDREIVRDTVERSLETGEDYQVAFRAVRPDGEVRHVQAFGRAVLGEDGEPEALRGALQDVTELEQSRRARERAEQRYRTLFEMSPLALSVSRPSGEMVTANDRFEELLGYGADELEGRRVQDLDVWVDLQDRADVLRRLDAGERVRAYATELRARGGDLLEAELSVDRVEFEGDPFLVWAIRDVTERNRYRRELEQKALYDELTGLPNRSLLHDRLEHALKAADRSGEPLSVVFADLDDFKPVNDSYGHTVGDRVLAETATRLRAALREADTLGRMGGDEFLAVLRGADEKEATKAARRMITAMRDSRFEVPDGTVRLEMTAGIASASPERRTPRDLIRAAGAALRAARAGSVRERLRVFTPEDTAQVTRLRRQEELRRALEADQFVLHYQPVVDLHEDRVAGAEALIRWQHPERGLVYPGDFIPLAEQTGLIQEVDGWSLREAARQAAQWRSEAERVAPGGEAASSSPVAGTLYVASNVAAPFYQQPDFADRVRSALGEAGLPPAALQLEITERLSVSKTGGWSRLRAEGVRLAVDDFGTGYSSLQYLRQLEADVLKVDRYFVEELTDQAAPSSVLARAVLSIGRQLGMDVIAEGVETAEQRDHLTELGYRFAQGYFFARPMPAAEFAELIGL